MAKLEKVALLKDVENDDHSTHNEGVELQEMPSISTSTSATVPSISPPPEDNVPDAESNRNFVPVDIGDAAAAAPPEEGIPRITRAIAESMSDDEQLTLLGLWRHLTTYSTNLTQAQVKGLYDDFVLYTNITRTVYSHFVGLATSLRQEVWVPTFEGLYLSFEKC